MRSCIQIGFLLYILSTQVFAQNLPENIRKDSLFQDLDSVIVFGQRHSSTQNSIYGELLSGTEAQPISILDKLPGITKIHKNGYPLVFRGMFGNRLRIEKNGVLKTGFVEHGYLLDDINPENIESVKLIHGAERILYGSGTLGGMVQINEHDASKDIKNTLYSRYATNNSGLSIGGVLGKRFNNLGVRFSGRRTTANDFKYPSGENANNSAYWQNNFRLSTSLQNPRKNLKLSWNNEFNNGLQERPQGFQNNPYELRDYKNNFTYQSDLHLDWTVDPTVRLKQQLWGLFFDTDQNRKNFNGDFTIINSEELRNYEKSSFGYKATLLLKEHSRTNYLFGLDFINSRLTENTFFSDNVNAAFSNQSTLERNEVMYGFYSMANLLLKKVGLKFSARADAARIENEDNHLNFTALTGGIELDWQMRNAYNSVSLTRSFRYPSQLESLGVLIGGRGVFYGNPSVLPEYAHQLEWSFNRDKDSFSYGLNTWLALFNDRISEVYLGDNDFTYENSERARTYGLEGYLTKSWKPLVSNDELAFTLNSEYTRGDNLETTSWLGQGQPLIGIPPFQSSVELKYSKQFSKTISGGIQADSQRFAALTRLPEEPIRQIWAAQETASYWLINFSLESNFTLRRNKLSARLSISNLTNETYFPFGARIMGMGRNFSFQTRFIF